MITDFIAVDWGSSSFRAYLIRNQTVDQATTTEQGVFKVSNSEMHAVLLQAIHPWGDSIQRLPIIMSGMVGSRSGWQETPYASCPVTPIDLATQLQPLRVDCEITRQHNVFIVPGVSGLSMDQSIDIMRGEEVQVFGAMATTRSRSGYYCLPGIRSKWVHAEEGAIQSLTTFMTGEFYQLLRYQSSLSDLLENGPLNEEAF